MFGLAVALPTLTAYHFLDQRIGAIALQMEWLIVRLDKLFDDPGADTEDTRLEDEARVEVAAGVGD